MTIPTAADVRARMPVETDTRKQLDAKAKANSATAPPSLFESIARDIETARGMRQDSCGHAVPTAYVTEIRAALLANGYTTTVEAGMPGTSTVRISWRVA